MRVYGTFFVCNSFLSGNIFSFQAVDDYTSEVPSDEYRNIPPQPDDLLTSAFLHGEYCLVGVSVHL